MVLDLILTHPDWTDHPDEQVIEWIMEEGHDERQARWILRFLKGEVGEPMP